ncbi:MAG: hypothetical protein LBB34_00160 [Holosporales bacterium]|nr:hypothetical protein [Holosporales bacterium]
MIKNLADEMTSTDICTFLVQDVKTRSVRFPLEVYLNLHLPQILVKKSLSVPLLLKMMERRVPSLAVILSLLLLELTPVTRKMVDMRRRRRRKLRVKMVVGHRIQISFVQETVDLQLLRLIYYPESYRTKKIIHFHLGFNSHW